MTGSMVPEDKPLPITRTIKIKKTNSGALKISDTAASMFGGWDACVTVLRIRAPRNCFWVPRNFLPKCFFTYYRISPGLQIKCLAPDSQVRGVCQEHRGRDRRRHLHGVLDDVHGGRRRRWRQLLRASGGRRRAPIEYSLYHLILE